MQKRIAAGVILLTASLLPGISLAQTQNVASLQAELQSLLTQVQSLEAQLATASGSTNAWCYSFNTNLSIGMSGNAVTELQAALQRDGESVQVTGTFDDQTASAVTAFQEKYETAVLAPYDLTHGTGYAGKSTRAKLNSFFGCKDNNPVMLPIILNPITTPIASSTPPIICPAWGCIGPEPATPILINSPTSTTLTISIANSSSSNIVLSGTPGRQYGAFIEVTDSGNATATVTGAASANWISIGPIGGGTFSLAPGQQNAIVGSVNVPSLAAGATLAGSITIAGNFPTMTIPVSFTNNAASGQEPTVSQVQGLTATVNGNAVTLDWQPATASDDGAVIYNIYRTFLTTTCTNAAGNYYIAQVHGTSYSDSPLSPGTYYYCVVAQDTIENNVGPLSAEVSATVPGITTTGTPSLTVQLDPTNPTGAQVESGVQNASLIVFDITNPSSDPIKITQLEVAESVMGNSSSASVGDFNTLNLYTLTNGQSASVAQFTSLSRSTNVASAPWFASVYPSSLVIPANTTVKFMISGNVPQYVMNPSEIGTQGAIAVGGIAPMTALDTTTNLTVNVSGQAYGNPMTLVRGQ